MTDGRGGGGGHLVSSGWTAPGGVSCTYCHKLSCHWFPMKSSKFPMSKKLCGWESFLSFTQLSTRPMPLRNTPRIHCCTLENHLCWRLIRHLPTRTSNKCIPCTRSVKKHRARLHPAVSSQVNLLPSKERNTFNSKVKVCGK